MKQSGASNDEIARVLGYKNGHVVADALTKALREIPSEAAQEYRQLQTIESVLWVVSLKAASPDELGPDGSPVALPE